MLWTIIWDNHCPGRIQNEFKLLWLSWITSSLFLGWILLFKSLSLINKLICTHRIKWIRLTINWSTKAEFVEFAFVSIGEDLVAFQANFINLGPGLKWWMIKYWQRQTVIELNSLRGLWKVKEQVASKYWDWNRALGNRPASRDQFSVQSNSSLMKDLLSGHCFCQHCS